MNNENVTASTDDTRPADLTDEQLADVAGGVPFLAVLAAAVAGELVRYIASEM
jgi:hypothetical protein